MGDRCYIQITLRTTDAEKHREALEKCFCEIGAEGSTTILDDGEANYAYHIGSDDWGSLAFLKGVPFVGHHSEGGDYAAADFCSDGERLLYLVCSTHQGGYLVSFNESGDPCAKELQRIKEFILFRTKVEALVNDINQTPNHA